ncbi:hypothetical protein Cni_G18908 [Canna indica]|uniref:Uncharacterized protein n=1 Tax=Canna indica TaxID=4628 RepID=A0AAQ3QGH8_9LILI|nr:hypothetical protein Cni_G18908 [Canna indica]
MMASRRVDLNLNHAPAAAYEDSIWDGLKQTMVQHEIVFKNQVRELHRLYWTQKNLMNEVCWRRSDLVSVHREAKEKQAGDVGSPLPTMRIRDFDLQLPAEEFMDDATDEFTNEFVDVNNSGSDECAFGVRHMNIDLNATEDGVNSSLAETSANMCSSRVTVLSDLCLVSRIQNEACHMPNEKYSPTEHQAERWQEENLIHSNAGLHNHGASLSANNPSQKQQTKSKFMHIDLNIAQDEEPVNISANNLEAYPSSSTSSSVILDEDNLRVLVSDRNTQESNVTLQPGVASLSSKNSRETCSASLPSKLKNSYPPSAQASGKSSCNVVDSSWNCKEYLADNGACQSQCCKSLVERFCSDYNGETQNSINGTVLDLRKPVKENIDSSGGQHDFAVHNDGSKNISVSSSYMEQNSLHASAAGSNSLPPNLAGGLESKQIHNERSEEDTVSSHAVARDREQQDELKESPTGIELNQLTQDGSVTPAERICSEQSPNFEGSGSIFTNRPHNCDSSQPKENVQPDQAQVAKLDNFIIKAAETLVSIFSNNLLCSLDRSTTGGQVEIDCNEEGNGLPETCDSYEASTLELQEEITDNASSICANQIEDETRDNVRGIQLRRGRRLRDFQKDVLPGMVSLSRHEICEDLYAIRYEFRKKRSRRASEDNWLVPVRSRRSRLSVGRRR